MTSRERDRIKRLEDRCVWLEARIQENRKCAEYGYHRAELSAIRWAIERLTTEPSDVFDANRKLKLKIQRQALVIRKLLAYQHRIAVTDEEIEALADAAEASREGPFLTASPEAPK